MLGKMTIDNTVRYVSKSDNSHSEQTPLNSKERDSKPNTRKRKASNNFPLKNKKFN